MAKKSILSQAYTAIKSVISGSKGTLSAYVVNSPPEYGQPYITSSDVSGLISPERMREIIKRTPTAGACLNAILDFSSSVDLLVRNVDAAIPANKRKAKIVEDYLKYPNDADTTRHFLGKIIWDLVILGFAAVEIEPNASGYPAKLHVLDGARFKVDYDEHGNILGYDMLDIHGTPIRGDDGVHAWTPDQIIYFRRDPTTDSLYPLSRILQLFSCAVIEDMMLAFIGGKFTESNIPYGIYDMGDISDTELKVAISNWNDQATSNHKIILTGSRGQSAWTQFGYALKDLEATQLLEVVQGRIMALLGVTKNEFGDSQDVNKGNGYNLSYTFKRRAIEPILNEITESLTCHFVHKRLNFKDLELYYEEIDSRDALLEGQIDDIYLKSGVYSPNYIANRKGLPSVPGGDDRLLIIGTNAIPLDLVRPFAQAQLAVILAEIEALKIGSSPGMITPPATRGPQPPGKTTVPDGVGSSGTRISYPRTQEPQQARGPVQAGRNAGMRKESIA